MPARVRRGGPQAQPLQAGPRASALPSARDAPREPQPEAAEASGESPAAGSSGHAAAEPRQAVLAALVPAVPQAVPEVVVSGRAAAGPQPEAVTAASERQAAGVAVEQPDEPQAEAVAAEVLLGAAVRQPAAAARLGGEAVRRPAAARRADGVVRRRAAVLPDARVLQAAQPLAVPSAAASVFHQGPSLATGPAGPARPRAAKRFAHAMRSLPIASRSEPWSQAARNEGWSCGELPRKVL